MAEAKSELVESIALERVPPEQKKSWPSIAFVWAGNVICVPALMVGGMVASGLPFGPAVLAMLLGYAIAVIIMVLLGMQASDLGVPAVISVSRAFGSKGSAMLMSVLLAISTTGWFSFQTTVCAGAFNQIMNDYVGFAPPMWLSIIFWGALMLLTAVFGFTLIKILNYISVPLLFIILAFGLVQTLSTPGAWQTVLTFQPAEPSSFVSAVTLALGGFAVGAVIAGDFTRYCKNRSQTLLSSVVGVIPAGVGVLVIGGILTVLTGSHDITVALASIGYPIFGLIALILATWTTNTGNAYSGAFAVMNIFKIKDEKRAHVTALVGVVGILLAIAGAINYFVPFLSVLSSAIPAVAGVSIADYWVVGRGKFDDWKAYEGVRWIGVISWAIGVAFSMIFTNLFIPALNSIIVAMAAYLILYHTVGINQKDREASGQNPGKAS